MAGSVSPELIETVQRHIYDALARTSDRSTLSDDEQDQILAQACAEACDILDDWRTSFEWENLRPSVNAPIAAAIPEWQRVRPFLDPVKQALTRIAQRMPKPEGIDPAAYIDDAIKAAAQTARRHPRSKRHELFDQAGAQIDKVHAEVCKFASDMKAGLENKAKEQEDQAKELENKAKRAGRRKQVRSALLSVAGVLLSLGLAMAGASPQTMRQNIPEWGHEAVKVLMVHNVAQSVQPGVRITPPRPGPQVR